MAGGILDELFSLSGRVALVTGASSGIGRELAKGLAAAGASVAVSGRDTGRLAETEREITEAGGTAAAFPAEIGDIDALKRVVEEVNRLPIHPRHPYAGELVYTAFSGSHQDAIQKGLAARGAEPARHWEVPYLPIDPSDVGRSYEAVIRVNSQSGKSGVQYVLRDVSGFDLPRELAVELSKLVQAEAERTEGEVSPQGVHALFRAEYVDRKGPIDVHGVRSQSKAGSERHAITVDVHGKSEELLGAGTGPIDAFARAVGARLGIALDVTQYTQHALTSGATSRAVAYVKLAVGPEHKPVYGVGVHENTVLASLRAIACAINRSGIAGQPVAKAE